MLNADYYVNNNNYDTFEQLNTSTAIDDYVETVGTCVICHQAVGFCVHTKQSPKHRSARVFFPPDYEEAALPVDHTKNIINNYNGNIQPQAAVVAQFSSNQNNHNSKNQKQILEIFS